MSSGTPVRPGFTEAIERQKAAQKARERTWREDNGVRPDLPDDMPYLYEQEAVERPAKPLRYWLGEKIECSNAKAARFIGICLAVGMIAGLVLCKILWP
jgi:hypothetical protein